MLKPKCIHARKEFGYSTTGHLTPCCWTNPPTTEPYLKDLFLDEIHIDNVDSIEDIITSEPWTKFYDILENHPEKAPSVCREYCSVKLDMDIEGTKKLIGSSKDMLQNTKTKTNTHAKKIKNKRKRK